MTKTFHFQPIRDARSSKATVALLNAVMAVRTSKHEPSQRPGLAQFLMLCEPITIQIQLFGGRVKQEKFETQDQVATFYDLSVAASWLFAILPILDSSIIRSALMNMPEAHTQASVAKMVDAIIESTKDDKFALWNICMSRATTNYHFAIELATAIMGEMLLRVEEFGAGRLGVIEDEETIKSYFEQEEG